MPVKLRNPPTFGMDDIICSVCGARPHYFTLIFDEVGGLLCPSCHAEVRADYLREIND